jgi:alanyl-tRNA synthetase
MQQFKEYFIGKPSPFGKRAVSCQKCFRTSDIESVGDESHLTFLEMLGNFSFGEYFKEEAVKFAFEFIFEELKLKKDDFIFTVFGGDPSAGSGQAVPFDEESFLILKKLGVPENKIKKCGRADNFWGPTGKEGPCGPTVEFHINDTELWNLVFNEYFQDEKGELTPLKQKGVDTGMGLERLTMAVQNKPSVFETDLFLPLIQEIEKNTPKSYLLNSKSYRIIADHTKSAVFLISEGIFSSNVERGYVLRRILRRAIRYGKLLNLPKNFLIPLSQIAIEIYKEVYPEIKSKETDILTAIQNEEEKFEKTLVQGIKEATSLIIAKGSISGEEAFRLYESSGTPLAFIIEIIEEKGVKIDKERLRKDFDEALKKHQEISRAGAEKKFGGVGKEASYEATKLHTATHLLHTALREILGVNVKQMGSDITAQRLRFDFSHPQKMTEEEIKKVEDLVNQKIKEDLEVKKEEMSYEEAIKSGALAFFKEKYPERVSVYSAGNPSDPSGRVFSREICAGPHVKRTSEIGHLEIIKEESSGAGVRRIRAVLQK